MCQSVLYFMLIASYICTSMALVLPAVIVMSTLRYTDFVANDFTGVCNSCSVSDQIIQTFVSRYVLL